MYGGFYVNTDIKNIAVHKNFKKGEKIYGYYGYKETPLAQSQVKRDIAKAKFEAAVNESWKILNHRTENLQITLSSKDSESINKLNIDELAKDYNKTNIQYLIEKSSLEYLAKQ